MKQTSIQCSLLNFESKAYHGSKGKTKPNSFIGQPKYYVTASLLTEKFSLLTIKVKTTQGYIETLKQK